MLENPAQNLRRGFAGERRLRREHLEQDAAERPDVHSSVDRLPLYLLGRLIYRGGEPLGAGDITIAALLGAMAGFPGVFTALLVGIFAGGIGAIIILATGGSRKVIMPYGPALCIGGLWAMLITSAIPWF